MGVFGTRCQVSSPHKWIHSAKAVGMREEGWGGIHPQMTPVCPPRRCVLWAYFNMTTGMWLFWPNLGVNAEVTMHLLFPQGCFSPFLMVYSSLLCFCNQRHLLKVPIPFILWFFGWFPLVVLENKTRLERQWGKLDIDLNTGQVSLVMIIIILKYRFRTIKQMYTL